MLIEAAMKNIHRTKKAWDEERFEAGFDSLALSQDIVAELLSSLDKESNPDLAGKIASIYVFIFRCLSESGMTHNPQKLDDALRVLTSERETWRQVCEKFGSTLDGGGSASTRLDLSTDSSAKILVSQPKSPTASGITTASGISTASFGKPKDAGSSGIIGGGSGITGGGSGITGGGSGIGTSSGVSWDV